MPYGFNDDKSKFDLSDVASLLDSSDTETLRNLIAYKEGDSIIGSCRTVGYVTDNARDIRFTIPLSLPIQSGVTIEQNDFIGWSVRQNGTYLYGSPSGNEYMSQAFFTSLSRCPSGINVNFESGTDPISGATNNAEVAIEISYNFILT